jgi:HK97 family phage major capsid protein
MDKILEMRQKRAALVKQAREILDRAEAEKRDLLAEEEQQYNNIMDEVDRLGKAIEREERQQALERELAQSQGTIAAHAYQPGDDGDVRNADPCATKEYRAAYWQQFRHGKQALTAEEYRALNVGTDAAGGFLVPQDFERRIIDILMEENVMRTLATVITSSSDRQIPVVASHGQAYWTAEEGSFTESDDSFGQKLLSAHKLTVLMKISEELLQDSAFDLETYVASEFARRAGVKEEDAFVAGDGVGKPRGVILDAQTGVTAASATAVAADELIDLFHSLRRPYRNRATWLMNDSTVKAIRKLKDTNGDYMWQPGLQAGQPDRLLGRPVAVSAAMPAIGAGAKSIAFGDYSFYWIADRQGRVFQRLNELYATTGHVGFRAYQRVDGVLVLPEAVKVLVHP